MTLLVPADRRDKANGLVGTVNGVAHLVTSVLSGLSVGFVGMGGTVAIAVVFTAAVLVHLLLAIHIDEPRPAHLERTRIDIRGVAIAIVGMGTAVREWQSLLSIGMFGFMLLVPIGEAAEQTILQRLVPFEKQGRIFGFAQSIETASTPVAAFAVGPAAQFLLIPYMESASGRATFGWLLGAGQARGIALAFVAASLLMLVVVLLAFLSAAYRRLNVSYEAELVPA